MSHKATNWLSTISATELGHSEFRVLFHLCDCHNPSAGCFPTQAFLIAVCGVSNGTLNNALNSLEAKGFIRRKKEFDSRTKKQKPTRYILGFEEAEAQEPTPKSGVGKPANPSPNSGVGKAVKPSPKSGDGKRWKPTPKTGDGADSNFRGEPSPISGASRLQPTGEGNSKEPVTNPGAVRGRPFFTASERMEAEQVADHLKAGLPITASLVPKRVRECLIAEKLVNRDLANEAGLIEGSA